MQKRIALFLSLAFLLAALSGCGGSSAAEQTADGGQKLSVVTTIFPEYDWVREIMGDQADGAEITLLLNSGSDLHSYQPTVEDMVKISGCDLFIYVGGESDDRLRRQPDGGKGCDKRNGHGCADHGGRR